MRIVAEVQSKKKTKEDVIAKIKNPTLDQFHLKVTHFVEKRKPNHFVTAILYGEHTVLALEDAINEWLIRVNRSYLGRDWHTPEYQYRGMIAFMEMKTVPKGNLAAHILVRAPLNANEQDFTARACLCFLDLMDSAPSEKGHMKVEPIKVLGTTPEGVAKAFIGKLSA